MICFYFLFCIGFVNSVRLTEFGVSLTEIKEILNQINKYRKQLAKKEVPNQLFAMYGIPLAYNSTLAEEAQKVANTCVPVEQKLIDYSLSTPGEASSFITSTKRTHCNTWTAVIESWWLYHVFYLYGSDPLRSQVPFVEIAAEFNRAVGCGYAQCKVKCNKNFTSYNNLYVCKFEREVPYKHDFPYQKNDCYNPYCGCTGWRPTYHLENL